MSEDGKPDHYQSYLQEKHSRLQTPESVIDTVVEKAVGRKAVQKQRLILGEANEVYDVATQSGEPVIVRISHEEDNHFKPEQWAIDQCSKVGVPVPQVLMVEDIDAGDKRVAVCVESKLPGVPLDALIGDQAITPVEIQAFVEFAGAILSQIHSVKTEGYGDINENGNAPFATWSDYMLRQQAFLPRLQKALQTANLDPSLAQHAIDILRDHQQVFANVQPQLIHGDFSPKHIFIDQGKITGIIDMENCKSGDPLHDLSWWDFFRGSTLPTAWLQNGYTDKSIFENDYELRMKLHRLYKGLNFIDYYAMENNKSGLQYARTEFLKDIDYFTN